MALAGFLALALAASPLDGTLPARTGDPPPFALGLEAAVGGFGHAGIEGNDPGAGPYGIGAGLHARWRWVQAGLEVRRRRPATLVGVWGVVHADLHSYTTGNSGNGVYRIRGAALGLLLRFGFEVGPDP